MTCARFYAAGATDTGACARAALASLLAPEVMATETPPSVRRSARATDPSVRSRLLAKLRALARALR